MKRQMFRSALLAAAVTVLCFTGAAAACTAEEGDNHAVFSGRMAGTEGVIAYYTAPDEYGEGDLYSYNSFTRRSRKIADGDWSWINVSGKYIILCRNGLSGPDESDYCIYRMLADGSEQIRLAEGYSPVVKDGYIYYLGCVKVCETDTVQDTGACSGIYRMDLDGCDRQCVLRAADYDVIRNLGVTADSLVYCRNDEWYSCSLDGENEREITIESYYTNVSLNEYGEFISDNHYALPDYGKFYLVHDYVYDEIRKEDEYGLNDQKLTNVDGELEMIILSGGYIMTAAVTYGDLDEPLVDVCIMEKNGYRKTTLINKAEDTGFWYY